MELVVDTNVVFSAVVKASATRRLLVDHRLVLHAPEGMLAELEEHEEEARGKSGLGRERYRELLALLLSRIRLAPRTSLAPFLREALRVSPDEDDAPFLALCISIGAPL